MAAALSSQRIPSGSACCDPRGLVVCWRKATSTSAMRQLRFPGPLRQKPNVSFIVDGYDPPQNRVAFEQLLQTLLVQIALVYLKSDQRFAFQIPCDVAALRGGHRFTATSCC